MWILLIREKRQHDRTKEFHESQAVLLLLVLLLIIAGMVASSLALGVVTTMSDDYGIIAISDVQSQNCPNGSEYDYSTGECVAINHDDD